MSLTSKLVTAAAAGAGSEPDLFILSIRGTSIDLNDIDVDSSGNIVTVGAGAGTGSDGLVVKLNPSGEIIWSTVSGGSSSDFFYGVSTDSSDNIYAAGYLTDGTARGYIQKLDSSGTPSWEKQIYSARNCVLRDCDLSTDESTLFIGGYSAQHNYGVNTSVGGFYYGKVNASDGSGLVDYIEGYKYSTNCLVVSVDDDGSTIFAGNTGTVTPADATMDFFVRTNSTLASTGETFVYGGVQGGSVADVAHAPSNVTWVNINGVNRSYYANMTNTTVNTLKINNLGTAFGVGVVADSDGNAYFLSRRTDFNFQYAIIVKVDASFNTVWYKVLKTSNTSRNIAPKRIAISNDGAYLYICGTENATLGGTNSGMVFKCPTDGSLNGTYGDFVYEDYAYPSIANQTRTARTNAATLVAAPLSINTPTVTTSTFTPASTNLETS